MSKTVDATAAAISVAAHDSAARPAVIASLIETTKPRITRLVTITSLVGFVLAAVGRSWTASEFAISLVACLLGTALSSAGANSLNQWWESELDAKMPRTARRPLPEHRVAPGLVLGVGIALSVVGVAVLGLISGLAPAAVSLTCILTYVLIYTPMKTVTPWATFVGAVPGALPPLIGWTAASGATGFDGLGLAGGWSLFALMFVWQIPHFLAIAWMYRDDYAKGGFRVLPVIEADGRRTARTILAWSVLLIPATLAPWYFLPESLGPVYGFIASATGLGVLWLATKVVRSKARGDARTLFVASIIHLPLLLVAMVAEALIRVIR